MDVDCGEVAEYIGILESADLTTAQTTRAENDGDLEIRAKSPFGGACAVIKVTEQEL